MKKIFFLGLCLNLINAALSGAASPPVSKIYATPASVNLGSVALGASSATSVITVGNKGKSALTITSVTFTGTESDEFSQSNTCGTVQPAGSCLVNVTFTPNLPYAKKTAILAIASDDPKKPTLNVKLSGQLPPPAFSATPASLNFGKLPAGTASSSKQVTITNKGLSDLVIDSMDISGSNPDDFTVTDNCGTIHQGGSCTIDVLFEPLVAKVTRSASMVISSNDPKKPTVSLKFTGSSTDGPVGSWDSSTWDNTTWGP